LGYTPQLAVGVWVGNSDNAEMKRGADGSMVAAPIWQKFMKEALKNLPVETFAKPAYEIPDKPMLGGDASGVKVTIDRMTGLLAGENTPEELKEEKTFKQAHSILHYVNKDDPQGPTPANPYSDPKGDGYQVIQSTIAVGSGMWTGRGLGRGTQSQLKFLPERHTDFIFASLVEELGFLGGAVVLGLYAAIILGLVKAAWAAEDKIDRLMLGSAAGWLFFQSAINIMMNLGLSPVTGITLPFLSSGGSSMVSSAAILGLALSVVEKRR